MVKRYLENIYDNRVRNGMTMNINFKQMKIDNGSKVLVYFQGIASCKEANEALMEVCKNKGISYIGVDFPGQGEAQIISNIDKPEMIYLGKLAAIHFNQINSDEIIVAGNCMGAAIALLVAAASYDKVSRIILESPVSPAIISKDGALQNLESIMSNENSQTKFINGKLMKVKMDNSVKEFYQTLGKDLASEKFIKEVKKEMSKVADKRIDVILGENDPIIPCTETMKFIKRIGKPNITAHVIPNGGHVLHEENKEAYIEIYNKLI